VRRVRPQLARFSLAVGVLFWPALALGQELPPPTAAAEPEAKAPWTARAAANTYFLKNASDYVAPVAAVDHGLLHVEGRYNYEGQRAGSLWLGMNLEFGDKVTLAVTPMFGVVFGDTKGFAPGLEWTLSWGPLSLYSELELVLDLDDSDSNFFYVWSEASGQVLPWLRVGMALQRTRAHFEPRLLQWGPLVGVNFWKVSVSAYWFNPGQSENQYWVVSFGIAL
jgi:hypothetical protein